MGAQNKLLAFPYGTADLPRLGLGAFNVKQVDGVQFWVGVGAEDNRPGDVPRAWDPYLGTTRVQRAKSFVAALTAVGAPAQLAVFDGATHCLTEQMRSSACRFLLTSWQAENARHASHPMTLSTGERLIRA